MKQQLLHVVPFMQQIAPFSRMYQLPAQSKKFVFQIMKGVLLTWPVKILLGGVFQPVV